MQPTEDRNRLASGLPKDTVAAVRDFVLVNFDSLRSEAQSGRPGEYTRALNQLLFAADRQVLSTTELQTVLDGCDGSVSCAEKLSGSR